MFALAKAVIRALGWGMGRNNVADGRQPPERLTEDGVVFDPAVLDGASHRTGGLPVSSCGCKGSRTACIRRCW